MSSLLIVVIIIAVNIIISVVYTLLAYRKSASQAVMNGVIMLLCPLVGPVYLFGAYVVEKLSKKERNIQMDDIGFSKEKRGRILSPDYETEIQSVPLEEVFIISQNDDKRKHLLLELKKEYIDNYSVLTKALSNDDPETSHYAASAISSAKADFENTIRKLDTLYTEKGGSNDPELVRQFADAVFSYLRSGILDKMEIRKYRYLFINILTRTDRPEKILDEDDYKNIVNEALSLGEFQIAELWANKAFAVEETEAAYLSLMKVYYYTDRPGKLLEVLDDLKASDLSLSSDGLDLVRFFIKARAEKAGS